MAQFFFNLVENFIYKIFFQKKLNLIKKNCESLYQFYFEMAPLLLIS